MRSQKSKEGGKKSIENPRNKENQEKQTNKKNNGKFPPCGICKRKSHLEKDCWFKGKPQCRNCKKFGHVEKACRLKQNHQANFFEEQESENIILYVSQDA